MTGICFDTISIIISLLGMGWEEDGYHRFVRHNTPPSIFTQLQPDDHIYIVTGVLPICAEKIIRVLPKGTPA